MDDEQRTKKNEVFIVYRLTFIVLNKNFKKEGHHVIFNVWSNDSEGWSGRLR